MDTRTVFILAPRSLRRKRRVTPTPPGLRAGATHRRRPAESLARENGRSVTVPALTNPESETLRVTKPFGSRSDQAGLESVDGRRARWGERVGGEERVVKESCLGL